MTIVVVVVDRVASSGDEPFDDDDAVENPARCVFIESLIFSYVSSP